MKKQLIICALLSGLASAAFTDYMDTKTMGVGMHDIRAVKAECEKDGKECVMLWDFMPVDNDYELAKGNEK